MSTSQLREQITEQLQSLSEDRLRVAYHFVSYLHEYQDNAATKELLEIEGFLPALERAERDADSGNTVPFAEIR